MVVLHVVFKGLLTGSIKTTDFAFETLGVFAVDGLEMLVEVIFSEEELLTHLTMKSRVSEMNPHDMLVHLRRVVEGFITILAGGFLAFAMNIDFMELERICGGISLITFLARKRFGSRVT